PPTKFGMVVCTPDGGLFQIGDAAENFSIQSVSKVFVLTLAMQHEGDGIWQRIGREPSGTAFNSLVQLEYENGIPRNPFINAGALVVTDMILTHLQDARQTVLNFVRKLADNENIGFDTAVAHSEKVTGYRNVALANFIKSFGNLHNEPDVVLGAYFHHCSLAMSCVDVARAGLFLANKGKLPWSGEQIVKANQAKYIKSLMLTCGTYDSVGDFAYRVGLPGKSGVGGGILAVMPGKFSICVWSPGLNATGNSLAGTKALELFTTLTGISIF
ncbi:Glutaminase, partial [hydrothermal vent metagenome]